MHTDRWKILRSALPFLITWVLPIGVAFYFSRDNAPVWPNPVKYLLLLLLFLALVSFELFYFHLAKKQPGSPYSYLLASPHAFVLTQLALFGNLSNWPLSILVCLVFFGMTLTFGLTGKKETGRFRGYNEFLILCLFFDIEAVFIVLGEHIPLFS